MSWCTCALRAAWTDALILVVGGRIEAEADVVADAESLKRSTSCGTVPRL
jgi:hypothetical protein